MENEIKQAIDRRAEWDRKSKKEDAGSWNENSTPQYKRMRKICKAYDSLIDALLEQQRG